METNNWTKTLVVSLIGVLTVCTGTDVFAKQCDNPHVKRSDLEASFWCNMDLADAERSPVLLVPGTTLKPDENFDWNYIPALDAMGFPVCTVEMPDRALASTQQSGEHIEYAIREAYRLSGHKVQIIGFSQGGMAPRWPLRFSPDIRQKVDDMISLSGSHHGSLLVDMLCEGDLVSPDPNGVLGCEAGVWTQGSEADFITALNTDYETVPEVDYTAAYSLFDEFLFSNSGPAPTSELRDGGENVANITLQDVCPGNMAGHADSGTTDPVGFAIALDALQYDGPASLDRLLDGSDPGGQSLCAAVYMPGVDPNTVDSDRVDYDNTANSALFNGTHLTEEPLLPCYTSGKGPK
jgi:hypothetical protein